MLFNINSRAVGTAVGSWHYRNNNSQNFEVYCKFSINTLIIIVAMTVVYDGNAFLGCFYLVVLNTIPDTSHDKKVAEEKEA